MFVRIGLGFLAFALVVNAADRRTAAVDAPRSPEGAEWRRLTAEFANQPDVTARFEERRYFPYREEPVVVRGDVRVSRERGISLHYREPEERIVIIDDRSLLVRDGSGKETEAPDPRANAANAALRQVLRMDFTALEKDFELSGTREGDKWTIELEPRTPAVRRAIGSLVVAGRGTTVQWIEFRRSLKQRIEIVLSDARRGEFDADEVKRFFR